jgi:hypothetical protein
LLCKLIASPPTSFSREHSLNGLQNRVWDSSQGVSWGAQNVRSLRGSFQKYGLEELKEVVLKWVGFAGGEEDLGRGNQGTTARTQVPQEGPSGLHSFGRPIGAAFGQWTHKVLSSLAQ